MHSSRSHDTGPDAWHAPEIDDRSRPTIPAGVPEDASLLAHELEAEGVGEKLPVSSLASSQRVIE